MSGMNLVVGVAILAILAFGIVATLGRAHRRADPAGFRPNAAAADADRRRLGAELRFARKDPAEPAEPTDPQQVAADLPADVPAEAERTIRVREWLTT